jgi:glycosyltransferase involved in cell wall biosynthesis
MRLLHVVPTYLPATRYGGPLYPVHGLDAALAARGHDLHVCTTNVDGALDSDVPLGVPVDLDGVKVWYFPSRRLRRLYWSPPMAHMLKQAVGNFDLVHLHSVFLWPTWAAARAARSARVPYVVSPRGMLVKDLFRARSRVLKSVWMALIERANLADAAGIHVTSAVEAAELAAFGYVLKGRVFEVPNGVSLSAPLQVEPVTTPSYVLMLGRINWKKRIDIALDTVQRVDGIRLLVAGSDEEGLAPSLHARAASLGVAERVEFVGPVDGMRKRQLLKGALALLMPSLSENFGNSAVEAMAEGTPVIVAPQVGVADSVKESSAGFVVAPTGEAFADAVGQLRAEPTLRARMGERARALVAERYAWPVIGARMENEYRAILNDIRMTA